jgi:ATP-binding protein involved in chromosome partitioning
MTAFVCEHGQSYPLFGAGGGQRVADEIGAPLIGAVPLDPAVATGGDTGNPVALDSEGPTAEAFAAIAGRLVDEILPLVEMSGCTARMLDRVEAALDG